MKPEDMQTHSLERTRHLENRCPDCNGERMGVQYSYDDPHHYDGISEWRCMACGARYGRWSARKLKDGEAELRYGGA